MKCWICEAEADTHELLVKESDLGVFFKDVPPKRPIVLQSDKRRNHPLCGSKLNKLKTTNRVICRRCDEKKTDHFDHAWSDVLQYFQQHWSFIKKSRSVKLQKIFHEKHSKLSLSFHLYFVKLFGCRIMDENLPIDIKDFSKSVSEEKPHPRIFLNFFYRNLPSHSTLHVGPSSILRKENNGQCEEASWTYTLGELDIQIVWFKNKPTLHQPKTWHPDQHNKMISFRRH